MWFKVSIPEELLITSHFLHPVLNKETVICTKVRSKISWAALIEEKHNVHKITAIVLHVQFDIFFQNFGSPLFSPHILAWEPNLHVQSNCPGFIHLPSLKCPLPRRLGGGWFKTQWWGVLRSTGDSGMGRGGTDATSCIFRQVNFPMGFHFRKSGSLWNSPVGWRVTMKHSTTGLCLNGKVHL